MSNTTIKIAKYDLEGNFLEILEGENYNQIAKAAKVDTSSLMNNLEGTVLSCSNFQFRNFSARNTPFQKLPEVWDNYNQSKKGKIIGKYYKNRLVCTYLSLQDAVKKNKIHGASISRCLSNISKSAGGFEWKYLN